MDASIAALRGHVIVCGYGRVGRAAADHLHSTGEAVVLVDADPTCFDGLDRHTLRLVGDVTDEHTLVAAGVERARAVIVCLESDADTVYVTRSARALAPDLVIVARARTTGAQAALEHAGATHAVNPQGIGGHRLAAFALQPDVADFLDVVMHQEDLDWRIQQVLVQPDSALAGHPLGELALRERSGALLLAVRRGPDADFEPNPLEDTVIPAGSVLIALGTQREIAALSALGH